MDGKRSGAIGHQLKGTQRESLGEFNGDRELVAAGIAEQGAGKAQNASGSGSARDEAREALADAQAPIGNRENTDAVPDAPKR